MLLTMLALMGLSACQPEELDRFMAARGKPLLVEPQRTRLAEAITAWQAEGARRASYVGDIQPVDAARLGLSWRPGCPVAPSRLRLLRLSYWGFDGQGAVGEMVVNAAIASKVVVAFRTLWNEKFPINRMETAEKFAQPSDFDSHGVYVEKPPGPDNINDTSAFFCRPTTGGSSYSQHAYGLALDINPVQNPYLRGSTLIPTNGAPHLNRGAAAPGMILAGSVEVRAFAAQGLKWGGNWTTLKDYMHFSSTGR